MPTVRIWTLESNNDRDVVECLANKLVAHLQLDNLSVQVFGKTSIPRRHHSPLRTGTENFLKDADCVIFVIDTDGPISTHERRQQPNSLINQAQRIVNDPHFKDKVFLARAVQELEAWLLIDCLGIFCYFARQSPQYRAFDRDRIRQNSSFRRLVDRHQRGNTESIVEAEIGGKGAKEYLEGFSEQILQALNPRMPQRNISEKRYKEAISPDVAEHINIDQDTLRRNNSLHRLGDVLEQFN